jgi:hypothetical protein
MQPLMQEPFGSLAVSDLLLIKHLEGARDARGIRYFPGTLLGRLSGHPDLILIVLKRSIE